MFNSSTAAPSRCRASQLPGRVAAAGPPTPCQLATSNLRARRGHAGADLAAPQRYSLYVRSNVGIVRGPHGGSTKGRLHHTAALAVAEPPVVNPSGQQLAPSDRTEEPDLVGSRYRLGPVLGRGSFGTVYLANDTHLDDRLVAVKKLSRRAKYRLTEEDQQFKVREEVRTT